MTPSPRQRWLLKAFLPYQLRWVLDRSPIALALKGRQLGFSDASAGWIVQNGYFSREPVVMLSASQRTAEEMVDTVRKHCEVLAALGERGATRFKTLNTSEIEWTSGGRLLTLSSNPRTGRSWHGHLVLDEVAYVQDAEKLWAAAAPMASRGSWKIRIISTPNGAQGLFYDWCTNPPAGWTMHRVSLDDALADGLAVDPARLLTLVGGDERVFNESYRLQFLDADLQYLPSALCDAALRWAGEYPDLSHATLHAGLDVGRTHDLTALTIVALLDGVAYVLACLTCKRTDFAGQRRMLDEARDVFAWDSLHVDAGGLGTQLAEELVKDYGASEVTPVLFTPKIKEELHTRGFRFLRTNRLRLPRDAEGAKLHREAVAVRRVVRASGEVGYQSPRDAAGHGDRWTSLLLALRGAGEPPLPRGVGLVPVLPC